MGSRAVTATADKRLLASRQAATCGTNRRTRRSLLALGLTLRRIGRALRWKRSVLSLVLIRVVADRAGSAAIQPGRRTPARILGSDCSGGSRCTLQSKHSTQIAGSQVVVSCQLSVVSCQLSVLSSHLHWIRRLLVLSPGMGDSEHPAVKAECGSSAIVEFDVEDGRWCDPASSGLDPGGRTTDPPEAESA
jgi:hypothetical protein